MQGVIDKIWENKTKDEKKYWVLSIGGENYSVWDKKYMNGIEEGATVEYEWKSSGDFRKVTALTKMDPEGKVDLVDKVKARNQQIVRMSCLKSATALVSNSAINPDAKGEVTLGLARQFERYVIAGEEEERKNQGKKAEALAE